MSIEEKVARALFDVHLAAAEEARPGWTEKAMTWEECKASDGHLAESYFRQANAAIAAYEQAQAEEDAEAAKYPLVFPDLPAFGPDAPETRVEKIFTVSRANELMAMARLQDDARFDADGWYIESVDLETNPALSQFECKGEAVFRKAVRANFA